MITGEKVATMSISVEFALFMSVPSEHGEDGILYIPKSVHGVHGDGKESRLSGGIPAIPHIPKIVSPAPVHTQRVIYGTNQI